MSQVRQLGNVTLLLLGMSPLRSGAGSFRASLRPGYRRQGWFAAGLSGALICVGVLGFGFALEGRVVISDQDSIRDPQVSRIDPSNSSLTRTFFRASDNL